MEDKWLEQLKQGKCMTERDLKILCEKVSDQPNNNHSLGQRNSG